MKYLKNILFYLAPLMLTAMMAFECGKVLDPPVGPGDNDNTEVPSTPGSGETPDSGAGGESGEGSGENPGGNQNPGQGETPTPEPYYVKVTEDQQDWSGEYLIAYESEGTDAVMYVFADWGSYGQPVLEGVQKKNFLTLMDESGLPAEEGDPYKAVITKDGNSYTINVSNVGYIGYSGSSNSLLKSETATSNCNWTLSYGEGNIFIESAASSGRILRWNSGSPRFACYKDSSNQQELTLYKRTMTTPPAGGGTVTPTPDPEPTPDPDPTPTPDPTPGTSQSNAKYGWYELPVVNYAQEGSTYLYETTSKYGKVYYAHHMCAGNEKGPGGKKARNYTVCYSAEHHCPVWVAAPRHTMYQSGASRTNAYGKDPSIPSNVQYSSESTGGGCNKGHMLGSAERLSSSATNRQVFYYTNIAPQYQDTFNTGGGGWNNLEDWVDGHVCSDTLYVVIGAYFKKFTDGRGYTAEPKTISFGGRSDVGCPTMFYYVLLRTKNGSSNKPLSQCTADELKCAAFVRSHKTPKGIKPSAAEMMSISDLEKVTGFTYFPNVPQLNKSACNPSDWGL